MPALEQNIFFITCDLCVTAESQITALMGYSDLIFLNKAADRSACIVITVRQSEFFAKIFSFICADCSICIKTSTLCDVMTIHTEYDIFRIGYFPCAVKFYIVAQTEIIRIAGETIINLGQIRNLCELNDIAVVVSVCMWLISNYEIAICVLSYSG